MTSTSKTPQYRQEFSSALNCSYGSHANAPPLSPLRGGNWPQKLALLHRWQRLKLVTAAHASNRKKKKIKSTLEDNLEENICDGVLTCCAHSSSPLEERQAGVHAPLRYETARHTP